MCEVTDHDHLQEYTIRIKWQPRHRVDVDKCWIAEVDELPGLATSGDTIPEACAKVADYMYGYISSVTGDLLPGVNLFNE